MNHNKTILITGGSGQLGGCLKRQLSIPNAVILAPDRSEMDITDIRKVDDYIQLHRPDIIIHCAGYSFVDKAESEPELCYLTNVTGTSNIVRAGNAVDAYTVYISTDYVFDGAKSGPYEVDDIRNPLSVYGKSKAEGEDIVLSQNPQNVILRTSWLFGHGKRNFVETIIALADKASYINVVDDQIGSPTYTNDLAELIQEIIIKKPAGILHGTNSGYCSWADFAEQVLINIGSATVINRISSKEYQSKAVRPLNSMLDKDCLSLAGLNSLPDWKDALHRYINSREIL